MQRCVGRRLVDALGCEQFALEHLLGLVCALGHDCDGAHGDAHILHDALLVEHGIGRDAGDREVKRLAAGVLIIDHDGAGIGLRDENVRDDLVLFERRAAHAGKELRNGDLARAVHGPDVQHRLQRQQRRGGVCGRNGVADVSGHGADVVNVRVGHAVNALIERGVNALHVRVIFDLGQDAARADVQPLSLGERQVVEFGDVLERDDVVGRHNEGLHVRDDFGAALHQETGFLILVDEDKRFLKRLRLVEAEIIENFLFHNLLLSVAGSADLCCSGHIWTNSTLRQGKDSCGSPYSIRNRR